MKTYNKFFLLITLCFFYFFNFPATLKAQDIDFQSIIKPVPLKAKFTDKGYQVWCGSMVKGKDGKYYLFYSRWPENEPFNNWVVDCEVAIAVSNSPLGPYKFKKVALPKRDKKFWDADCTHNPTIHEYNGKYYLYYMGNFGNGEFWNHRNHQRIGVAVAKSPLGLWKRPDMPLIDVSPKGYDSLMVTNPAVCKGPGNKYVMIYKAVNNGPMPFGGTVYHLVAFADKPDGPFVKQPNPVFYKEGVKFAAEDPYIWFQGGKYWALVKDNKGFFTNAGTSITLFESKDALDWKVSAHPLAFRLEVPWVTGLEKVDRFERPQLYFEKGKPAILFAAIMKDNKSYNVAIPLKH